MDNATATKKSFDWKRIVKHEKFILILTIIALCIIFWSFNHSFISYTNITNVLRQLSTLAIGSVGVTLALLLGGIDLSIGSMIGVASVFGAMSILGVGTVPGIILCVLLCTLCGAGQGWIIAKFGIPAFIVTLGGQQFFRGAVYVATNGMPISGLPKGFLFIGSGNFLNIPIPAWITVAVFIIFHFFLTRTKPGRYLYAIGGNEDAAILSGIKVRNYKIMAHAMASGLAGIAGLIMTARVVTGQPTLGEGQELDCIAATVIGGTSFRGGEGSMAGTALGVILISIIRNGLNLMKVSSFIQMMVIGALIILAVILDTVQRSKGKLK